MPNLRKVFRFGTARHWDFWHFAAETSRLGADMAKKSGGWDKVYQLVKRIPRGRVVTYGQLAKMLRLPGGARTAGYAIAACPSGQGIPWHRVVGEKGKILPREPY